MRCPYCSSQDVQVKDSRSTDNGDAIKRRRYCVSCDRRFNTIERVQIREITIKKKDGNVELLDRSKIERSMNIALRNCKVNKIDFERAVNNIMQEVEKNGDSEISVETVADHVLTALKGLSDVAFLRYLSVYKSFNSIDDFSNYIAKEPKNIDN